jgi:hypothetical protein
MCPACRKQYLVHYLFMTYHRDCNKINTMEATRGTDNPYPFAAPEFTHYPPAVYWGSSCSHFALSIMLGFTTYDDPFGIIKLFFQ